MELTDEDTIKKIIRMLVRQYTSRVLQQNLKSNVFNGVYIDICSKSAWIRTVYKKGIKKSHRKASEIGTLKEVKATTFDLAK